jgi:hypothetical protein
MRLSGRLVSAGDVFWDGWLNGISGKTVLIGAASTCYDAC